MKVGIVTFHAAHNFGAALQAYALCKWINDNINGVEAELIDFQPQEMKKLYSINPCYGGLKNTMKRLISTYNRSKQISAFKQFQKSELIVSNSVNNESDYQKLTLVYDCIVYGSDQIWNLSITGNTDIYWGKYVSYKKIAYAASFGNDKLTEYQKQNIKQYLHQFDLISVREKQSIHMIEECSDLRVYDVVDPVFLLGEDYWKKWIGDKALLSGEYILYYSLRNDDNLISQTESLAKKERLPIYIVHPIAQKQKVKGKQLFDIGPKEFMNMVFNAKYVCTNSFHAMAFSCIFKKKVLHVSNKASKGRVGSLMQLFEFEGNEQDVIDFSEYDYGVINLLIGKSKDLIKQALLGD